MSKILNITVFTAIFVIITVLAMVSGVQYDWPDNVHTDYGMPLTYATHTTSTFVGPADLWSVDIGALAINLTLWLGTLTAATAIMQIVLNKKQIK
jgi:hypothetical protein